MVKPQLGHDRVVLVSSEHRWSQEQVLLSVVWTIITVDT